MYRQKLLQKHLWIQHKYRAQLCQCWVLHCSRELPSSGRVLHGVGVFPQVKDLRVFCFRRAVNLWKHSYASDGACTWFYSCIHQEVFVHLTPHLKLVGTFCLLAGELGIKEQPSFLECLFLLNDQYFANVTFSPSLWAVAAGLEDNLPSSHSPSPWLIQHAWEAGTWWPP